MTKTEEKARKIVIKMQFQTRPIEFEQAKNCALICVDEVHELLNKPMFQYKESMLWKAEVDYWNQVKQEIVKL
jgi:hypothetical protein